MIDDHSGLGNPAKGGEKFLQRGIRRTVFEMLVLATSVVPAPRDGLR